MNSIREPLSKIREPLSNHRETLSKIRERSILHWWYFSIGVRDFPKFLCKIHQFSCFFFNFYFLSEFFINFFGIFSVFEGKKKFCKSSKIFEGKIFIFFSFSFPFRSFAIFILFSCPDKKNFAKRSSKSKITRCHFILSFSSFLKS